MRDCESSEFDSAPLGGTVMYRIIRHNERSDKVYYDPPKLHNEIARLSLLTKKGQ